MDHKSHVVRQLVNRFGAVIPALKRLTPYRVMYVTALGNGHCRIAGQKTVLRVNPKGAPFFLSSNICAVVKCPPVSNGFKVQVHVTSTRTNIYMWLMAH